MHKEDPKSRYPFQPGECDIIFFRNFLKLASHNPRIARYKGDSQCKRHLKRPRSKQRNKDQRQQKRGKSKKRIHQTHQRLIQPTTQISAKSTNECAYSCTNRYGQDGDQEGDPASIENTAEDISAKLIRSHPVTQRYPLMLLHDIHCGRIIRHIKKTDQHKQCQYSRNQGSYP